MLQMLTSKDTNFIGYTFKKSDVLKSLENSGMLLYLIIFYTSHYKLGKEQSILDCFNFHVNTF